MKIPLNSKGAAIITVVVATLVISSLVFTGLVLTQTAVSLGSKDMSRIKAFYLADAGIQRALFEVRTASNPTRMPSSWRFAGENVHIRIALTDPATDMYQVTSGCAVDGVKQKLTAKIQKQKGAAILTEWSYA